MLPAVLLTTLAGMLVPWQVQGVPYAVAKRASICNGDASLCSRRFSNVTFVGTHDSYAVSSSSIAANQEQPVAQQLADGVRMLQAQAHKSPNATSGSGIDLCHTDCQLFNGGSLEAWLGSVKTFVDANPNEVVTLLLVNSDGLPASTFAKAYQSTGLDANSWQPSGGESAIARNAWPTLGSMIDSRKTVVSFLASGADVSSVPYLLPEFSSIWENPYNQLTVPFNCSVDRIGVGQAASNLMYLINHFKDLSAFGSSTIVYPDKGNLSTTNSEQSILSDANNCAATSPGASGNYPTFILLDFYDTPSQAPFKAAAQMNGIQYKPAANASKSEGGSSKGSGSSGSSSSSSSAESRLARTAGALSVAALTAALLL
ncbi:PLC-like phosphodiesterase [Tilletiaria anomala UBC 951]|uniref:PLC-like phosphodiesterase n=1 Tax=Tilletiaria anomala (strain ATCC 24038 / CBS 436.72 / UBC 951) TaxID=1037660 RepID=A0A066VAQ7_TILAU|nr:PLC-like phosphodiesterase [Tilletiaria anomala UBC 951]KDN38566.1 PLC-like phosphodiesterase [Tilletiaria anomala UBC 951]